MNRSYLATLLALLLVTACGPRLGTPATQPPTQIPSRPSSTPPPTATPIPSPTMEVDTDKGHPGLPLPTDQEEFFDASGACAICHNNMTDEEGADVSIVSFWRSTMMANAARDPYWQAAVAEEVFFNPDLKTIIEDTCANCHTPMARFLTSMIGEEVSILDDDGYIGPDHELHTLAMDGVSCSLCHQIRENGLGGSLSYSGQFVIDEVLRKPDRVIFGPYTIEDKQADIMQSVSGFRPEQGLHMTGSSFCATCHTLYTPYVDATGQVVGEFPEQVPYLEWFYSDYRRTRSCQSCHMPEADGGIKISNTSQVLRSPFALHSFVGGNAYMLEILKTFPDENTVTASSEAFENTIDRTLGQLHEDTATISLDEVRLAGSRLYADVVIENLAGHKFPTGFPARRAWIHFVVSDANGQVIFESGAYNTDGAIVGNDNDIDPLAVEQHYLAIVQPDQVQIYEAILQDTENHVTTVLLKAARYLKDNRLLPSGFEKAAPYEDIAVRGGARDDEDFQGGGDEIQYIVDIASSQRPFTVLVELLYQPIGYRWAENLRSIDEPEVIRFIEYYDSVANLPYVVASDTKDVDN